MATNQPKVVYLSAKELRRQFESAWMRYNIVDAKQHEQFGTLVQGFVTISDSRKLTIIPFHYKNEKTRQEVMQRVTAMKTTYLGVAFVRNYIHYNSNII